MASFNVEIKQEGLKNLLTWAKSKLTEDDQKALAQYLDETIHFTGWIGIVLEQLDGKLFETLVKRGIESIFPEG